MKIMIRKVPAGQSLGSVQAGDFFLIHRNAFMSRLIQLGQRRRYSKQDSRWNHCGIFTAPDGSIAEALVRTGVTRGNISKYEGQDFVIVHIDMDEVDRKQVMAFVDWAVNKPYGVLTDISLAVWCLIGGKFDVSLDGTMICSGFVARALERAGFIFDRDPTHETPADLACHFKVLQS